ncbi:hypothetical protein [uncultured Aliiroseovarius sp.]|uniref:hypothetical protein n=1 Tax=uncultured Aliiroseovarius sp. TaxID=1658783 RepID=UPI002630317F|nr:hypothetical protein [uncultured Aliiroseovarius sp.]
MKILTTVAASVLMASQAFAGSYEVRCQTTSVPYEETVKGGEPEKVIGGALIGGVIGKVVTDDAGGAAAGAIIGGAIGHNNSQQTVTKYKEVETCRNVFIPEQITDADVITQAVVDLNSGRPVSKEMTMDVQYTIGVAYDGKWGPMSRRAAAEYLGNLTPTTQPSADLYSLVVNDVVIVSSADANSIDEISKALMQAGVESQIFVNLQ